RATLSDTSSI
ncbi:ATP-dependent zinc protease domain protein, partial [Chlamydia psittaci 06-1683]